MASRISSKSAFCTRRSSSSAAASSARRVGQDHPPHDRQAVLAEEHVLGAAQADALGAELAGVGGVGAVVGVGPHGELALADLVGPAEDRRRTRRAARPRTSATSPSTTSPVVPSIEITSPSRTTTSPDGERRPSIWTASAPTTAGLPQPRATTAAWLTQAAPGGEDALGDHHAVHVLGRRLAAHEDHVLAPLGGVGGVVGGEVDPADGGTRRRAQALGDDRVPGRSANCGCSTWSRCSSVIRCDRLLLRELDVPARSVMSTAIRSAAAPVRLPTRVWSIQSLPCSMVNSVSHMSR